METSVIFKSREEAGRRLAARLLHYKYASPLVLALPRGGVPVAYQVARALAAPLDVVVVRKLGAPGEPEFAIGAIVDGDHPHGVLNEGAIAALGVDRAYLEDEIRRQLEEVRRRQAAYRGGLPPLAIAGHTAIVIDDGLATGSTMHAALRGVRRAEPRRLVLAVPVAPPDALAALAPEVDDVVCLSAPDDFRAVGRFYRDFRQTTDREVVRLLDEVRRAAATAGASATA